MTVSVGALSVALLAVYVIGVLLGYWVRGTGSPERLPCSRTCANNCCDVTTKEGNA